MNKLFKLVVLVFAFISFNARAHEGHAEHQKNNLAISVAFDTGGKIWRASVQDGFVLVASSDDLGKTFSPAIKVNQFAQKIGAGGEARPKIAIGPQGNIYVTWTQALNKPFSGYIWFARSINHGESFEQAYIVHQDRAEITHGFDALNVAPNGIITVTWVDKRDLIAAKAAGKPYDGAAIYYAVSKNDGISFAPEKKLADSSCECCRIAFTNKPDGTVVAMWRHIFAGSERDHMLAEIPTDGATPSLHRATFGHWKIDGCPHQGPALVAGEGFGYHMAWFDGGNDEDGKNASLYYARMDGDAWVSSVPKKFGNNAHQAAHPALLSQSENVWLVWREINSDNKLTEIYGKTSSDGGRNWSDAKLFFSTAGVTDYPILLINNAIPYLAINTAVNGFKLISLSNQ